MTGLPATRAIPVTDPLSKRSLGFAAAPVATGYSARDIPAGYRRPDDSSSEGDSSSAGNSSSVWDLAATDVFPVASPEPPADPDEDAPGASGS